MQEYGPAIIALLAAAIIFVSPIILRTIDGAVRIAALFSQPILIAAPMDRGITFFLDLWIACLIRLLMSPSRDSKRSPNLIRKPSRRKQQTPGIFVSFPFLRPKPLTSQLSLRARTYSMAIASSSGFMPGGFARSSRKSKSSECTAASRINQKERETK